MKKLIDYQTEKHESKNINGLAKLFYWAAGADIQILERSSYSDKVKMFCLGGIILATGILAGLAGGYAFYTVFAMPKTMVELTESLDKSTVFISIVFGFIWGYIILNLDRYIVSSTGKGDGTDSITWKELKNAFPRIILGTIIALTISNPLEIRMLQSEINAELRLRQDSYLEELRDEVGERYKQRVSEKNIEIERTDSLRSETQKKVDELQEEYINETTREGRRGEGPIAKGIKREQAKSEAKVKDYENDLVRLRTERDRLLEKRDVEQASKIDQAKSLDGLAERIRIAHEKYPDISLFITLLFLALELTPIFFKLMIIRSPYDYLEANVHKIVKAREAIEFRPEYYKVGNDEDGNQIDYTKYYVPEQMIAEQKHIAEKQTELSKKIVDKWTEKKVNEINENVDDFVDEGDNV